MIFYLFRVAIVDMDLYTYRQTLRKLQRVLAYLDSQKLATEAAYVSMAIDSLNARANNAENDELGSSKIS